MSMIVIITAGVTSEEMDFNYYYIHTIIVTD